MTHAKTPVQRFLSWVFPPQEIRQKEPAARIQYPLRPASSHPLAQSPIWEQATRWATGDNVLPHGVELGVPPELIHDANDRASTATQIAQATAFPGIPALGIISQLPEFRSLLDAIAVQMLNRGWQVQSTGKTTAKKLQAIEAEFERLKLGDVLRQVVRIESTFGRAHIMFDIGAPDEEFIKPLLNTSTSIRKGALQSLRVLEPLWVSPVKYNSNRPWKDYYYQAEEWNIIGTACHESRLHTFVSDPVPDYLRPGYVFCGVSLVQKILPHLDNNLRTTQYVQDMVRQSVIPNLSFDMESLLQPGMQQELFNRLDFLNQEKDGRGIFATNKETEEFTIHSVPLQGLAELQAQSLEKIGSLAGIPMIVWLGTTPAGLNASSAGEMSAWHQRLGSWRQQLFAPFLDRLVKIVQLSIYGTIDPTIQVVLDPPGEPTELEQSQIKLNEANAAAAYVQVQALSPETVGEAVLAADNEYSAAYEEEMARRKKS